MKNADVTTILLKALDLELKAIIQSDLEQFRAEQSKKKSNGEAIQIAA